MTAKDIIIRAAVGPNDLALAHRLFSAYLRELGVDLSFQNVDGELANLPGPYAPPHGTILLAESNGEAIGVVALKPLPEQGDAVCELKRLWILPSMRGQGLAQTLCDHIEAEARLRGYRLIKLDTLARLSPAKALYEGRGYTPCAPYNDNPYEDILYFEKPL